jgi:hypothetical protein
MAEVTVVTAGAPPPESTSQIASLLERKAKILEAMHKDFEILGWDSLGGEKIYLRVRPITSDEFSGAINHERDAGLDDDRKGFLNTVDWIVTATTAVFAKTENCDCEQKALKAKQPFDRCTHMKALTGTPDGPLAGFSDPKLAEMLGCDSRASAVCEALFLREGDLLTIGNKVLVFSGFAPGVANSDF